MQATIELSNVMQVYSGKVGCMCGCNGKYKIASKHVALADADCGYGHGAEDVSDRSVSIIVNKIQKMIEAGGCEVDECDQYVYVEKNGRCWAAYFADYAEASVAERAARKAERADSKKKNAEVEAYESFFARVS